MDDKKIPVCSKCLRSCCVQGLFMCDDARNAGIIEKSVEELKILNLEHESYYNQPEN